MEAYRGLMSGCAPAPVVHSRIGISAVRALVPRDGGSSEYLPSPMALLRTTWQHLSLALTRRRGLHFWTLSSGCGRDPCPTSSFKAARDSATSPAIEETGSREEEIQPPSCGRGCALTAGLLKRSPRPNEESPASRSDLAASSRTAKTTLVAMGSYPGDAVAIASTCVSAWQALRRQSSNAMTQVDLVLYMLSHVGKPCVRSVLSRTPL
jgi:hypothetical protein